MRSIGMFAVAMILALTGIAYAADAPPGATSCTGCHPATKADTPVPSLKGRAAAQTVAAMAEFKTGKRPSTVMDRIAKGFTDDETKAIAAWFAAQKE
jgi:cytochrome c553